MAASGGTPHEGSPLAGSSAGCFDTPTLRSLWFAAVFFGLFSIAEGIGCILSLSLQLFGDALSTFVDASTYAINIYAEHTSSKAWRVGAVSWSITALTGVTSYTVFTSQRRLRGDRLLDADIGESTVLAYACVNAVIDVAALSFVFCPRIHGLQRDPRMQLNLVSAIAHVATDTMRTIAMLTSSLVVLASGRSEMGPTVDAIAALVVCGVTYCVVAFVAYKLIVHVRGGKPLVLEDTRYPA